MLGIVLCKSWLVVARGRRILYCSHLSDAHYDVCRSVRDNFCITFPRWRKIWHALAARGRAFLGIWAPSPIFQHSFTNTVHKAMANLQAFTFTSDSFLRLIPGTPILSPDLRTLQLDNLAYATYLQQSASPSLAQVADSC